MPAPLLPCTCPAPLWTSPCVLGSSQLTGTLPWSGWGGSSVPFPIPNVLLFLDGILLAFLRGSTGDTFQHTNPRCYPNPIMGPGGGGFGLDAQPPAWDKPEGDGSGHGPQGQLQVGRLLVNLAPAWSLGLLDLDCGEGIRCHLGVRNKHFLSTCGVVTGLGGVEILNQM